MYVEIIIQVELDSLPHNMKRREKINNPIFLKVKWLLNIKVTRKEKNYK